LNNLVVVECGGRQTILLPVDPLEGNHEWYSLLGFLQHRGYPIQPISAVNFEPYKGKISAILLAGKTDRHHERTKKILRSINQSWEVAIVGREVAYQHEAYCKILGDRGRAFSGDPHFFVETLLKGSDAEEAPVLWNPGEYRCSYLDAPWTGNTAYIRLSNGCQRTCGYCPYGYHFQRLYGADRVLTRPVAEIEKEIVLWDASGRRDFRLVADQVLICPEERNDYLEDVCRLIARRTNGSRVSFTTTPCDVINNRRLLADCQQQVSLRIFLCFDTMVDPLLARFNLPYREAQISEAVNLLTSLRIDVYPHFIFINPFMNCASILRTIDLIEEIIPKIKFLDWQASVDFVRSLFCSALRQDEVTPADPMLRLDLKNCVPDAGALGFAAVMMRLFHSEALRFRFAQTLRTYADWPNRFVAATRDLCVRVQDGSLMGDQAIELNADSLVDFLEKSNQ
jgi:hypothetical protein